MFIATNWAGKRSEHKTKTAAQRAAGSNGTVTGGVDGRSARTTLAKRNPSSGAKQRARGTRPWARAGVIEGSAEHGRRLAELGSRKHAYAAAIAEIEFLRQNAKEFAFVYRASGAVDHLPRVKKRHAALLAKAAADRPRLPNPRKPSAADKAKAKALFDRWRKQATSPSELEDLDESWGNFCDGYFTLAELKANAFVPQRNPSSGAKQRARKVRDYATRGSVHGLYMAKAKAMRELMAIDDSERGTTKAIHAETVRKAAGYRPRLPKKTSPDWTHGADTAAINPSQKPRFVKHKPLKGK